MPVHVPRRVLRVSAIASVVTLAFGAGTRSGRSLDRVGVDPDVTVASGDVPQIAERRAVEVLTGLVAALGGTGRG